MPETLAAVRSARRDQLQTSLNLAFGSAMASIGLTIPAIAVASIWLDDPLQLGLGATQMVLLALTVAVSTLTIVLGAWVSNEDRTCLAGQNRRWTASSPSNSLVESFGLRPCQRRF